MLPAIYAAAWLSDLYITKNVFSVDTQQSLNLNLFMSVCTIFSYVILGWCHEILGLKSIIIFLSFLWNLFWGKLKLRKVQEFIKKIPKQVVPFFTYYHNKFSSQNNIGKYCPDNMKTEKCFWSHGFQSTAVIILYQIILLS